MWGKTVNINNLPAAQKYISTQEHHLASPQITQWYHYLEKKIKVKGIYRQI